MKDSWYGIDIEMPPLSLRDTPQECIGELINAIIVVAYADYFGTDARAADDAAKWFREKEYEWLTTYPLDKYLEELEALGASENPRNEWGNFGREGRYKNRFFIPNREVRKAMRLRNIRTSDLAKILLIPERDMERLMQVEQDVEVQKAWARICLRQPYRYKGQEVGMPRNYERKKHKKKN